MILIAYIPAEKAKLGHIIRKEDLSNFTFTGYIKRCVGQRDTVSKLRNELMQMNDVTANRKIISGKYYLELRKKRSCGNWWSRVGEKSPPSGLSILRKIPCLKRLLRLKLNKYHKWNPYIRPISKNDGKVIASLYHCSTSIFLIISAIASARSKRKCSTAVIYGHDLHSCYFTVSSLEHCRWWNIFLYYTFPTDETLQTSRCSVAIYMENVRANYIPLFCQL